MHGDCVATKRNTQRSRWSSIRPAIHLSYFAFRACFCKTYHKIWNTYYTLFNYKIFLTFRKNATLSTKWCKTRKNEVKCEKSAVKYHAICFWFFTFREHVNTTDQFMDSDQHYWPRRKVISIYWHWGGSDQDTDNSFNNIEQFWHYWC